VFKELQQHAYVYPIALVAIHTGARMDNIVMLRWRDVDVPHKLMRLPKTKNGKPHTIPLNDDALDVFHNLPHTDPRVFPGLTGNQVGIALKTMAMKAGVDDFHFHDLRHTFGSYLAMSGVHPRTIQTLMGHESLRTTQKYMHLHDDYSRAAVEKLREILGHRPPMDSGN
jgi:integrase